MTDRITFDRYFFIKLAIGTALGTLIAFSAISNADAKINYRHSNIIQEFCGDRYCGQYQAVEKKRVYKKVVKRKHYKNVKIVKPVKSIQVASADPNDGITTSNPVVNAGRDLVAAAKSYLGSNPTGWRSLWCGRFMALIAPSAAAKVKNPNWARDWATLPRTAPRVGAIAVLTRGRGGHIGVVSGFDRNGNPIIISGNHNRRVGEGVYSKHRVIAYVSG